MQEHSLMMTKMMILFPTILSLLCVLTSWSEAHVVTGVHAGINNATGARPFRLEINKFKNSGPAWDLYILSLRHLMAVDQGDKYSYYKLASMYYSIFPSIHSLATYIPTGIHGYPANTPWDGVVGSGGGVGYCEHGSVLFPVWHRPYLALFEVSPDLELNLGFQHQDRIAEIAILIRS